MTSQDLRLKLANEGNRLNHEKAQLQLLDEQWKEKRDFVQTLSGAVQAMASLLREQEAAEKAGEARANELAKAMEAQGAKKVAELKE